MWEWKYDHKTNLHRHKDTINNINTKICALFATFRHDCIDTHPITLPHFVLEQEQPPFVFFYLPISLSISYSHYLSLCPSFCLFLLLTPLLSLSHYSEWKCNGAHLFLADTCKFASILSANLYKCTQTHVIHWNETWYIYIYQIIPRMTWYEQIDIWICLEIACFLSRNNQNIVRRHFKKKNLQTTTTPSPTNECFFHLLKNSFWHLLLPKKPHTKKNNIQKTKFQPNF